LSAAIGYDGAMISYRTVGLPAAQFVHLSGLDDAALAGHGVKRYLVDQKPGFPDRVELRDLELGEHALLLNYVHQPADTPYRSSHAIFVREGTSGTYDEINRVPDMIRIRLLSLRAFDSDGMMLDADVIDGMDVDDLIQRMFADPNVVNIHVHAAKRGCFMARIERA
jgi:hypothetical protein